MSDVFKLPETQYLPEWLIAELRSDHAGETGAVFIYQGILSVSRNAAVRDFARSHLKTEQRHLELLEAVLPSNIRSVLLPFWRAFGFLTGALPAVFGAKATYATIAAVETFVDHHYLQQINRLHDEVLLPELADLLASLRQDEIAHKKEAQHALTEKPGKLLGIWCATVEAGSSAAVSLARWA